MRLGFLELPENERRLYFDQAAITRNISLVRPWIADVLPAAFADWRCEVVGLDLVQFMGKLWIGETRNISPCSVGRASGSPTARLPVDARHVSDRTRRF